MAESKEYQEFRRDAGELKAWMQEKLEVLKDTTAIEPDNVEVKQSHFSNDTEKSIIWNSIFRNISYPYALVPIHILCLNNIQSVPQLRYFCVFFC